jgi:hypothetical protein
MAARSSQTPLPSGRWNSVAIAVRRLPPSSSLNQEQLKGARKDTLIGRATR